MIDLNAPAVGQQPRALMLEVVQHTFEAAMKLTEPGAEPPLLQPSIDLARAAQGRDDVLDLDEHLQQIAVSAMASRVKLRASAAPIFNDEEAAA